MLTRETELEDGGDGSDPVRWTKSCHPPPEREDRGFNGLLASNIHSIYLHTIYRYTKMKDVFCNCVSVFLYDYRKWKISNVFLILTMANGILPLEDREKCFDSYNDIYCTIR